ncbi:MAG: 2-C-methyl-D-erythritol 2,4-cyclodiphosphate synthase [Myxococcales bacterium]|nr:MAG: 2-C-methyl-D-erythritol 2,4-cyclodiphosphate synthase [Myxococcales bacterium]
MFNAIIVGAGSGKRMGGPVPKQFLSLRGKPLVEWSISAFQAAPQVSGIVVVLPEDYHEHFAARLRTEGKYDKLLDVVVGGKTRQESVYAGLRALPTDTEWVAVHDAVRPFVTPQLIQATFTLAQQLGAAIPTVAIHDTLIQVDPNGLLVRPLQREAVRRSQTPQIFRADLLADAHERAIVDGVEFSDDATLVSYYRYQVGTFTHYGENRKITTPQDMEKIAMQKVGQLANVRVGQGFDAHRLVEGRPLILGGVRFPFEKGLEGHSDADVVAHAICDAILGAASLGDIGEHFPDTDPAYKNVTSVTLLEETAQMVRERGFEVVFVDATVICEQPKLAGRRYEMCEKIAQALSIDSDLVSLKATTTEGMGFMGRQEGIAAMATATLQATAEES